VFLLESFLKTGARWLQDMQPPLSEDPSPAELRERASGAAVAVFFATAVTRG
jgi:hypothetical protein